MAKLAVGDLFPTVTLKDIGGVSVEFPAVFAQASSTVVFFYRGRSPMLSIPPAK
jgi:peroxiredoxin